MKAAAYIRTSHGDTQAEQRKAIEERAKQDGATLVTEVVETNVSGGKASHLRELEQLVVMAEQGEIETIYVLDFSRLSREHPYHAALPLARIFDAGGRVVGVLDGFDSSSPTGA